MLDNQTNNGQHQYAYTYDYVGNRLEMTVTNAGGVGIHLYSYDNIYQITEVNYPDSLSYLATDTEFNYDDAGNRSSVIDGSGTCNYTTNNLNQYTAAGPTNFSYDSSGNMTHDANYGYGYDPENRLIQVTKSGGSPPDSLAEALDCGLIFITDGNNGGWSTEGGTWCYHDWDCASGSTCDEGEDWLQTTVQGAGTLKFWWKVSSETWDVLEFYIDDDCKDSISGEQTWAEKTYTITGTGTHTLRWRYAKDGSEYGGEDRGWVDYVQWSGSMEEPDPNDWSTLNYVYDPAGRRVEKKYDGRTVLKYVYDGGHCIAEYDAGGALKRKYIYGPCVDEPIAMIESTGSYAGTYYYHFDALGSVVALTNTSGNAVQVYEYDVYGRVGATDANHPNRIMFTGREYDKETGLYYYRARYYNPQIGRFLQTDPIGYGDGMNMYAYCRNDPVGRMDPSGANSTNTFGFSDTGDDGFDFWYMNGNEKVTIHYSTVDAWLDDADSDKFQGFDMQNQVGWEMAGWNSITRDSEKSEAERLAEQKWWFWRLTAVMLLDTTSCFRDTIHAMERDNYRITLRRSNQNYWTGSTRTLEWNPSLLTVFPKGRGEGQATAQWNNIHPLVALAHELEHAAQSRHPYYSDTGAVIMENRIRWTLYQIDNSQRNLYPRPGVQSDWSRNHDAGQGAGAPTPTVAEAWAYYNQHKNSIGW